MPHVKTTIGTTGVEMIYLLWGQLGVATAVSFILFGYAHRKRKEVEWMRKINRALRNSLEIALDERTNVSNWDVQARKLLEQTQQLDVCAQFKAVNGGVCTHNNGITGRCLCWDHYNSHLASLASKAWTTRG